MRTTRAGHYKLVGGSQNRDSPLLSFWIFLLCCCCVLNTFTETNRKHFDLFLLVRWSGLVWSGLHRSRYQQTNTLYIYIHRHAHIPIFNIFKLAYLFSDFLARTAGSINRLMVAGVLHVSLSLFSSHFLIFDFPLTKLFLYFVYSYVSIFLNLTWSSAPLFLVLDSLAFYHSNMRCDDTYWGLYS